MIAKLKGIHRAWWVMIGCCFLQAFALGAILNAAGIYYVPVCTELGFTRGGFSIYLLCYFIATSLTMPFVGKLLPKWDIRKTLSIAFVIVAVTYGLMGTFNQLWQWWIGGIIFGVAGGFVFMVPAWVLIENWFDKKRGTALGIAMCASGLGGALVGQVGTYLIMAVGWRLTYPIIAVAIMVLVLPWTLFVFRYRPTDIGLLPYGHTGETKVVHTRGLPANKAVKSAAFWAIFLFCGVEALFAGFNDHFPGWALSIGYSEMFGANILSYAMIGYVFSTLVMGWLSDRLPIKILTFATIAIVTASLIGFLVFRNQTVLYVCAFVFGMNSMFITITVPGFITEVFGTKDFAPILAYSRMAGLIASVGPSAMGYIYDFTGSFNGAFYMAITIMAVCAVLTTFILTQRARFEPEWEDDVVVIPGVSLDPAEAGPVAAPAPSTAG